jgi:hypothetical protein
MGVSPVWALVWQRKPVFKQARRLFSLLFATFGDAPLRGGESGIYLPRIENQAKDIPCLLTQRILPTRLSPLIWLAAMWKRQSEQAGS